MGEPRIHVFHRACYVLLGDCVSSVVDRRLRGPLHTVMREDEAFMRYVLPKYKS